VKPALAAITLAALFAGLLYWLDTPTERILFLTVCAVGAGISLWMLEEDYRSK
jgi:hypothetical protein